MISVDEALGELLKNTAPICEPETIPIDRALFRILATPAVSEIDVPPADNSAMDGYAVDSSIVSANHIYSVSQRIVAGNAATPLEKNTAARIFTGAEIPEGADSVIIQENAEVKSSQVTFFKPAIPGENIRRRGQDVDTGAVIVGSGVRLRPQEIGLMASCGLSEVSVFRPLRIAIVSTGDELVEPGSSLKSGQIYNSNKYMLNALCEQAGFDVVHTQWIEDDLERTKEALSQAAKKADVVLSSGGVSVGDEDHIKTAVSTLGQIDLWKVAIKPGKPIAYGKIGETDFIGLPGNPASVFTTFLILALPRLKRLQGVHTRPEANSEMLPALFERAAVHRREYLRAKRTASGVEIYPNQSSGVLSSACWGDGFAVQYEGTSIQPGQPVEFISYQSLF